MTRRRRTVTVWLSAALLVAATSARGQSREWRPVVPLGAIGEIRVQGRLDATVRTATPETGRETAEFDWQSRRLELEGTLFRRIEFEVSREFGDPEEPERDAFVNLRLARAAQVQAGRFKIPFGRDALTSGARLDFVLRSLAGRQLAPGRDVGLMAHGRLAGRRVSYEVGYFKRDGDRARTEQTRGARDAVAGRVLVTPFASEDSALAGVQIGAAMVRSRLDDQLGLRGRTVFGEGVFFDRVFVNGLRVRRGFEAGWSHGPASASFEYIGVSDERRGMGLQGEALPNVHAAGWYLVGTWVITGEAKDDRVAPRRSLLEGGPGAVEIAARVERLAFDSTSYPGTTFGFPRPETLSANAERVTTLGFTWYLHRFVKVQGNLVVEAVDDPQRSPVPRVSGRLRSGVFLIQVAV